MVEIGQSGEGRFSWLWADFPHLISLKGTTTLSANNKVIRLLVKSRLQIRTVILNILNIFIIYKLVKCNENFFKN